MTVLGIVLIVIGVLFLLLGLARAGKEAFFTGRASAEGGRAGLPAIDPEKWKGLITALTEFVKAAPMWLLLVLVGAALIAAGVRIV